MSEGPRLGAAVVGTGIGVLTHVRALRAAGIEVLALVGRDSARTAERARPFDVPTATTELAEALALPGVDVVTVATPPHAHAGPVLAAVAAGKHVVCEKPFARDAAEARTMLAAAETAGVVHLLGFEWRFGAGQALLTRTIRSGAIGTPRHATVQLQLGTHADPAAELPEWWKLASEGGGWLNAQGSHVIDLVRSSLGEIAGASGSVQRLVERPGMTSDDTFTALLRLRGDATVILHSTCAARGEMLSVTKYLGTEGAAWLRGEEVWVDTGAGPQQLPPPAVLPRVDPEPPPADLITTAYDSWHSRGVDLAPFTRLYGVLRDRALGRPVADDPVAATFADGLAAQVALDAIRDSSTSGGAWTAVASS